VLDEYADVIAEAIIETFSRWDRRAMRPAAPYASMSFPVPDQVALVAG
jgi:hypothetical protein